MTKAELRKTYLAKRLALSQAEYTRLNGSILKGLIQLRWDNITYVHCFWPIAGKRETDTLPVITWLQTEKPVVKIVLSQADFKNTTLVHRIYTPSTQMQANSYGIMEPTAGTPVQAEKMDRVLVPLLAFDKHGNRVGYGKGFYDKFLAGCTASTEFIGLSFFEPVDVIDDVNDTDIKLTACITPSRTYLF